MSGLSETQRPFALTNKYKAPVHFEVHEGLLMLGHFVFHTGYEIEFGPSVKSMERFSQKFDQLREVANIVFPHEHVNGELTVMAQAVQQFHRDRDTPRRPLHHIQWTVPRVASGPVMTESNLHRPK